HLSLLGIAQSHQEPLILLVVSGLGALHRIASRVVHQVPGLLDLTASLVVGPAVLLQDTDGSHAARVVEVTDPTEVHHVHSQAPAVVRRARDRGSRTVGAPVSDTLVPAVVPERRGLASLVPLEEELL